MILNFLKELPDRYVLVLCLFVVMGFYVWHQSDAILQLMINFAVAIIALSQKKGTVTEVTADTVQTNSVNTNSMPDAQITTDNVNLDKKDDREQ